MREYCELAMVNRTSPSKPGKRLERQESTAEERIAMAGQPGSMGPPGASAAPNWGSHSALHDLALAYARERLKHAKGSDASLARRLIGAVVVGLKQPDLHGSLRGPTATQQVLALLSSAVPQKVAHADEAEADSDDEDQSLGSSANLSQSAPLVACGGLSASLGGGVSLTASRAFDRSMDESMSPTRLNRELQGFDHTEEVEPLRAAAALPPLQPRSSGPSLAPLQTPRGASSQPQLSGSQTL